MIEPRNYIFSESTIEGGLHASTMGIYLTTVRVGEESVSSTTRNEIRGNASRAVLYPLFSFRPSISGEAYCLTLSPQVLERHEHSEQR